MHVYEPPCPIHIQPPLKPPPTPTFSPSDPHPTPTGPHPTPTGPPPSPTPTHPTPTYCPAGHRQLALRPVHRPRGRPKMRRPRHGRDARTHQGAAPCLHCHYRTPLHLPPSLLSLPFTLRRTHQGSAPCHLSPLTLHSTLSPIYPTPTTGPLPDPTTHPLSVQVTYTLKTLLVAGLTPSPWPLPPPTTPPLGSAGHIHAEDAAGGGPVLPERRGGGAGVPPPAAARRPAQRPPTRPLLHCPQRFCLCVCLCRRQWQWWQWRRGGRGRAGAARCQRHVGDAEPGLLPAAGAPGPVDAAPGAGCVFSPCSLSVPLSPSLSYSLTHKKHAHSFSPSHPPPPTTPTPGRATTLFTLDGAAPLSLLDGSPTPQAGTPAAGGGGGPGPGCRGSRTGATQRRIHLCAVV